MFVELWDGSRPWSPRGVENGFRIHDRATLAHFFTTPDFAFADGYTQGTVTVEGDLREVLREGYRPPQSRLPWPPAIAAALIRRPAANTTRHSKKNIHHHYDLGNDFYRLWLDKTMGYTCAYFPTRETSLEDAQRAKYEHVCRKLDLREGETVVEAGCGWGSLALHAAKHHGVKVRAFNVSTRQIEYAREQARKQGLADRVEFIQDDYREARGRCDAFMSVGMLEHVGRAHYPDLARVIDRVLSSSGGRGLLHFIGRNRPMPTDGWLERRIFPGAHIPALREALEVLEPVDMGVTDVENLRLHYALTLEHWLERFEANVDWVRDRFDEDFVRMWRMYLVGSIVAFETGWTSLFQITFARADDRRMPWTREAIYRDEEGEGAKGRQRWRVV
jgi:cyclopropane-fatty-acyl-phospholipid synthase